MAVTTALVKELRERTGAGMMDCKKALGETEGDMEKAIDLLRQKGLAVAQKRAGRSTSEGVVQTYIHAGGKIGRDTSELQSPDQLVCRPLLEKKTERQRRESCEP